MNIFSDRHVVSGPKRAKLKKKEINKKKKNPSKKLKHGVREVMYLKHVSRGKGNIMPLGYSFGSISMQKKTISIRFNCPKMHVFI